MSKLSFLDKLQILLEVATKEQIYFVVLMVLLLFGLVISFTNRRNEKLHKFLYLGMTAVIITVLIASYHTSLGKMMKYMMDNFFIVVYFPNIAIYLAAIIAMNIIVWVSIFSFKSSRQIRALNISIYVIMNYLMALLLKVITSNKLDIFNQSSLYGNKQATALIELSSIVFVVWIIFLTLYKVILIYIRKDYKPKVKRIIVRKKVKKLPENFQPLDIPNMVYGTVPHKETLVIDTKEKTEEEILLEHFSKQFTLEDYKLFSKLLKEQQSQEVLSTEPVDKTSITEIDREAQKQEIIRMEEERRELLRQEQERQEEEQRRIAEEKQRLEEEQRKLEEEKQRLEQEQRAREEEQRKLEEEKERLAKEQQEREEQERRQRRIQELQAKEDERERRKEERRKAEERRRLELIKERLEQKKKDDAELELLLQQTLAEEEKEQRKLSELEELYR